MGYDIKSYIEYSTINFTACWRSCISRSISRLDLSQKCYHTTGSSFTGCGQGVTHQTFITVNIIFLIRSATSIPVLKELLKLKKCQYRNLNLLI